MKLKIELSEVEYSVNTDSGKLISIPVIFNGEQPNTYDVDKASAKAYEAGSFIGDTRRGGGCNFEEYRIIPHCNGTHTECVGHISFERISINKIFHELLFPATLITITPEKAFDTNDTYDPKKNEEDRMITLDSLADKLKNSNKDFLKGLIIRTLPNEDNKLSLRYSQNHPPFFSTEAMKYLRSFNVEHLLLDIPSVDRTFDEGKLTAHHIYWDVERMSHEVDPEKCSMRTITEMVYVPNQITDGNYFTSIQIPDFRSDAAPSRIMIYEAKVS
jgi:kynurenine formamidase